MFPKATADALKVDINLRIDEAKEQIKWALNQGIEITHLDNHMRTCMDHEEELLKICYENGWGYRFHEEEGYSDASVAYLKNHYVPVPDYINYNDGEVVSDNTTYESHAAMYKHMLHVMPEGITEWFTHPAIESDELKAIAPDYRIRINDYRFLMSDEFINTLKEENITLIGYEDIRRIGG
ncbi:MAG: ChbG/HpnK family deacetylase, partial [Erysipelotrichaceae bacterium]